MEWFGYVFFHSSITFSSLIVFIPIDPVGELPTATRRKQDIPMGDTLQILQKQCWYPTLFPPSRLLREAHWVWQYSDSTNCHLLDFTCAHLPTIIPAAIVDCLYSQSIPSIHSTLSYLHVSWGRRNWLEYVGQGRLGERGNHLWSYGKIIISTT